MFKMNNRDAQLQSEIDRLHELLAQKHRWDDSYGHWADQLQKLYAIRDKSEKRISPDTLVSAAASIAGILIIIGYEHGHVITTKALSFVGKLR